MWKKIAFQELIIIIPKKKKKLYTSGIKIIINDIVSRILLLITKKKNTDFINGQLLARFIGKNAFYDMVYHSS